MLANVHKLFTNKFAKTIDILVKVCYNIDTVKENTKTQRGV